MTNDEKLMQQALEMEVAIKAGDWKVDGACDPDMVLNALRARLAEPPCKTGSQCIGGKCERCGEPEPVAWADKHDIDRQGHDFHVSRQQPAKDGVPLYTAPPQREWQGLTDEEAEEVAKNGGYNSLVMTVYEYRVAVQRATEAKLKEKNA